MRILIAGAGIGGLAAALSLQAAGFDDVKILEAARDIRELGVGINLPPHAVRELTELGLGDALARIGVETAQLRYHDRRGELIWAEPRGRDAGYRWPQYSVHRGKLQQMLLDAVNERLGPESVLAGHRVADIMQTAEAVEISVVNAVTDRLESHRGDLFVGADGIRSAARAALYGRRLPLASNGWIMYRGAARAAPFLSGRAMVIAGDEHLRVVAYPLDAETINWLVVQPGGAGDGLGHDLGNWNRPADPEALARQLADWRFDWLDIPDLVAKTEAAYAYPMADIDPLPQWTFGRATLMGDAAHAMYPFGSNGASQAILDARVLAHSLAHHASIAAGLSAYEAARREQVGQVQLANRRQAGDVMARVGALSRANAHGQAMKELQDVEREYKRLAGFDADTLNQRPSWTVSR